MREKYVLLQVRGEPEKTDSAMEQIEEKMMALGIKADDRSLKIIPEKLPKKNLKNTKTKNICIKFSGPHDEVKNALDTVENRMQELLGQEPDYVGITAGSSSVHFLSELGKDRDAE